MSSLVLSNLAAQTRVVHAQTRIQHHFRRRWVHNSLKKQAIMMPALSPFATEGTVTKWKIKEGEKFAPGDVLLQIENETGVCDVEACSPGIMGKILTPDGTDHVPVEAIIAIVARDAAELASIQAQALAPTPPPFVSTPPPPSASLSSASLFNSTASPSTTTAGGSSPRHPEFKLPAMMSPRTPRTPSLFEKHAMGYGQRSAHIGGPRGVPPSTPMSATGATPLRLDIPPPCPSPKGTAGLNSAWKTPVSATYSSPLPRSGAAPAAEDTSAVQMDGAALRRMIVANLAANRGNSEVEQLVWGT
ncbi:hypothetical protein CC1G_03865 [Coprinopsis cinerea okayama7|uniref:Lipoyl-binding domain-containing protein n=1 Tax=Coprinopsis cinerea (strain Okayama-7 / 130 / ATCC MYA-4618 / FGSC 9003) TaxID=240176 RepID=A8NH08_COPC7|nr:hypothetical protein CC1G_03865 [Coprinopsis cinerea okayama7\|eukprot:XP_001833648.2 hypothetical protein CC1G_03865 [Coprinopsis cinerea okayama7\